MRKNAKQTLAISVAICMCLIMSLIGVAAALPSAEIVPLSQEVSPGESFSVGVFLDTDGHKVVSGRIEHLTFSASVIETAIGDVVAGDLLVSPTIAKREVDNTAGTVRFDAGDTDFALQTPPGNFTIVTFTVKDGATPGMYPINITWMRFMDETGALWVTPDIAVTNGTFTVTGIAVPKVVINEFLPDPASDWNGNGTFETYDDEFIELYNYGSDPEDISGWELKDVITPHTYTIPDGTVIDGGEWLVFFGNTTGIVLNNPGDTVLLLNDTGVGIDSCAYTSNPGDDISIGRLPDGDAWNENLIPTPGAANEAPAEDDTTVPTTVVTIPPDATTIPSGTELPWTTEDVNISFRRTDDVGGTGVDYTNYSKTSETGPWTTVNATTAIGTDADNVSAITDETFNVTVSDEGITKIYYYSVDKNDTANVEDTKNLTVRIDKTAPDIISVELNKTSVNASESINVSVNVTDPVNGGVASGVANVTADGVELTKQNGNWWNGTITAAAPGLHNVTVTAFDNASNTATNDTMQYEVKVIAEITAFEIENPTADLGQNFVARINITTTENATAGWYVVVVSGVNETTGEGLAGIGTVRMVKDDFVENMPVLVHIPPVTTLGDYELYAGLYRLEDYPSKLESILDHEGPETVTVTYT